MDPLSEPKSQDQPPSCSSGKVLQGPFPCPSFCLQTRTPNSLSQTTQDKQRSPDHSCFQLHCNFQAPILLFCNDILPTTIPGKGRALFSFLYPHTPPGSGFFFFSTCAVLCYLRRKKCLERLGCCRRDRRQALMALGEVRVEVQPALLCFCAQRLCWDSCGIFSPGQTMRRWTAVVSTKEPLGHRHCLLSVGPDPRATDSQFRC